MDAIRICRQLVTVLAAMTLFACMGSKATSPTPPNPTGKQAERCNARIIVTLSGPQTVRPDQQLVQELSRSADVRLTLVNSPMPGTYVFFLTAMDADPACHSAIERLRRDPRVRSVEVDTRMKRQD